MSEAERFRAAIAALTKAEERANPDSQCRVCNRMSTLKVEEAERALLQIVRDDGFARMLDLADSPRETEGAV